MAPSIATLAPPTPEWDDEVWAPAPWMVFACHRCDQSHALDGMFCPAQFKRCWTCRAKGHFAVVCAKQTPCCTACLQPEHFDPIDCEARDERCWRCDIVGHFQNACRVVDPRFRHGQAIVVEYQGHQHRGVVLARMKGTLQYRVEILPVLHDGRKRNFYMPKDGFDPIFNLTKMWPTYNEIGNLYVACGGCKEGSTVDGVKWRLGCNSQSAQFWVEHEKDNAWEGCLVRGPLKFPPRKQPKMKMSTMVASGWL